MYKLVLIDDDSETLSINQKFLEKEGFKIYIYDSAINALNDIARISPDCIVLDVMMPDMDGFTACKKIRTITKSPIIFLTGRTSEDDKLKGLILGADDYLIKPYSLKELCVRIKVNIRRSQAYSRPDNELNFPPLCIDTLSHKITYNGEEISLSNKEYELLLILASKPNETVTFEDIGVKLWGTYQTSDRQTIMVNMSRLRKRFSTYEGLSSYIETVWSKGYIFKYRGRL